MSARFYCDSCNDEIGDPGDLQENSTIVIQTSEGPLSILMQYGYGRPHDNTFRPNTGCICKRCIFLELREQFSDDRMRKAGFPLNSEKGENR